MFCSWVSPSASFTVPFVCDLGVSILVSLPCLSVYDFMLICSVSICLLLYGIILTRICYIKILHVFPRPLCRIFHLPLPLFSPL